MVYPVYALKLSVTRKIDRKWTDGQKMDRKMKVNQ